MSLFSPPQQLSGSMPDMQTMYPQSNVGAPQYTQQAPQMPMGPQGAPPQNDMSVMQPQDPQETAPTYIGDALMDKYIHMFIGA